MLTGMVSMLTERLPMLTENVHLVPLQGHVTRNLLGAVVGHHHDPERDQHVQRKSCTFQKRNQCGLQTLWCAILSVQFAVLVSKMLNWPQKCYLGLISLSEA